MFHFTFGDFGLGKLLNRVIFIDDAHTVLPPHTSNIFYKVESIKDIRSPFSFSGKLMICTSERLDMFFVLPFTRSLLSSNGLNPVRQPGDQQLLVLGRTLISRR
jgi:hypothetical protein